MNDPKARNIQLKLDLDRLRRDNAELRLQNERLKKEIEQYEFQLRDKTNKPT